MVKVSQLYTALEAISQGKPESVDSTTANYAKEKGLVNILDNAQYSQMQSDASRLDPVEKDIVAYRTRLGAYEAKKNDLVDRLASGLHNFFSSHSTIDSEKNQLDELEKTIKKTAENLSFSRAEKTRLQGVIKDLSGYVKISEGYINLTSEGSQRMSDIKIRLYRMADKDYEEADKEFVATDQIIEKTVSRFIAHYESAMSSGLSEGDKTRMAMAILSKRKGQPIDNIKTFNEVVELLSAANSDWKDSGNYGIIASLMPDETPAKDIAEALRSSYQKLIDSGFEPGSESRLLAGRFSRDSGESSIDEKIARYKDIKEQYGKHFELSSTDRMGIVSLMKIKGTAQEVVESFKQFYDTLDDEKRPKFAGGERLRLAASTLFIAKQNNIDADKRFEQVYNIYNERGNGIAYTGSYPILAAISMMPGTVDEVLYIIDKSQNRIVDALELSAKRSLDLATLLSGTIYQSCYDSGVFDQIGQSMHSSDYSSASTYDSSSDCLLSGFSIPWALYGDLVDNGSIDLSSGFVFGGIVGGLIDDDDESDSF